MLLSDVTPNGNYFVNEKARCFDFVYSHKICKHRNGDNTLKETEATADVEKSESAQVLKI